VHAIVPIEPAHRIGSAIHVVDAIITDNDGGVNLGPIFAHGLTFPRSIDRGIIGVRDNVRD